MPYPNGVYDLANFPELSVTVEYGSVQAEYFMVN